MSIDDTKKYFIDHAWWWFGVWNICKSLYRKKIALELFFKHAKELLGSFGVTITLKILFLVDSIESHRWKIFQDLFNCK